MSERLVVMEKMDGRSLLYCTKPTHGATLLAVSALLAAVALLACGVPVFRATRVDPQVVLRSE